MNISDPADRGYTTLQNLPPEILDRILMKALHFEEYAWVKAKQYLSNDALLQTLARLPSVTSAWRSRLNTNWFRIVFKRRRKRIEAALSASPVLVKRSEWFARDPTSRAPLNEPVSLVVILNTVEPDGCYDEQRCTRAVQSIQNYFIDVKGWADIAYNFLIGEDGRVYEGRGWKVHGAHTLGYNDSSVGISFIGYFASRAPCDAALRATQELIRLGVKEGHIAENYSLRCHRDLRPDSTSPGQYLYQVIKGWPNYKSTEL